MDKNVNEKSTNLADEQILNLRKKVAFLILDCVDLNRSFNRFFLQSIYHSKNKMYKIDVKFKKISQR